MNTKTQVEIDLDDAQDVSMIRTIMADEKSFYVLANKKCGRVGLYLFAIDINNPENITYILNRPNKMEVSDCSLQ